MMPCDVCTYNPSLFIITFNGVVTSLCSDCMKIFEEQLGDDELSSKVETARMGDQTKRCPKCEEKILLFGEHKCPDDNKGKSKDWLDVMKDLP